MWFIYNPNDWILIYIYITIYISFTELVDFSLNAKSFFKIIGEAVVLSNISQSTDPRGPFDNCVSQLVIPKKKNLKYLGHKDIHNTNTRWFF